MRRAWGSFSRVAPREVFAMISSTSFFKVFAPNPLRSLDVQDTIVVVVMQCFASGF